MYTKSQRAHKRRQSAANLVHFSIDLAKLACDHKWWHQFTLKISSRVDGILQFVGHGKVDCSWLFSIRRLNASYFSTLSNYSCVSGINWVAKVLVLPSVHDVLRACAGVCFKRDLTTTAFTAVPMIFCKGVKHFFRVVLTIRHASLPLLGCNSIQYCSGTINAIDAI